MLILEKDQRLPDSHFLFTSATQVEQICQPLKQLGIVFFCYDRCYFDGSHIRLSNDPNWMRVFYDKRYHNTIAYDLPDKDGHVFWSCYQDAALFEDARNGFNIAKGVTLIERAQDSIHRYGFGTPVNHHGIDKICYQDLDLLYRFVHYFKERGLALLQQANQHKILLAENRPVDVATLMNKPVNDSIRELFLQQTQVSRYYLDTAIPEQYLTHREAEVATLIRMGKTVKMIAKDLLLSPRTVEEYMSRMKSKLGCCYKSELLNSKLKPLTRGICFD